MRINVQIAINPAIEELARGDRLIRGAVRGGIHEAFADWHANALPQRFAPGAAQKFGHSKRTRGYLARKGGPKVPKRFAGYGAYDNYRPLTWTGNLKRAVTSSFIPRDETGANRLNVQFTLPATSVVNFWTGGRRTKRGLTHDLAAEIATFTPAEIQRFNRIVEDYALNFINNAMSEGERFMLGQIQRVA